MHIVDPMPAPVPSTPGALRRGVRNGSGMPTRGRRCTRCWLGVVMRCRRDRVGRRIAVGLL